MDLKQYIRRNYKTPNPFILEGLGASDELIAYLRYTPENTNFNVTDPYCGGTDGEQTINICFTKTEGSSYRNSIASGTIGVTNFTVDVDIEYDSEADEYSVVVGELLPADTPHASSIISGIERIDADAAINLIETNGCTDIAIYWE